MSSISPIETTVGSEIRTQRLMFLLLPLVCSLLGCWSNNVGSSAFAGEGLAAAAKETVIQVKGLVSVKIPAGTFLSDQRVKITKTSDKETAEDFETSVAMYPGVSDRAQYEIRVNTGKTAPAKPIFVEISVPEDLNARLSKGGTVKAFVQFFYDGENETLDHFESVDSLYEPKNQMVRITLEPNAFTNLRNADGTFEVIMIIAGMRPGKPDRK